MLRPQPARPPLGNAYLFGLLQARRAQTSNQKNMARWAQIWAPKLGSNLDPKFGPQTLLQLEHCLEKKDRAFSGPCLGSENGANFANKLGSKFEKRAVKTKLATLLQTANISSLEV